MAGIKAGDSGTVLEFPIKDGGVAVPLSGATVTVVFKQGSRRFEKDATITDAIGGLCEITMTAEDLAAAGGYVIQGIVKMQNGNEFASDVEKFSVGARI
jgi:hypothetical protein